jgi:hypothetical protein
MDKLIIIILLVKLFLLGCIYGKLDRIIDLLKGEYYDEEDDL